MKVFTQNYAPICSLKHKLVVSCQAAHGDPLDSTDTIRRIALAAVKAGASGLRINGQEHIAAVREVCSVPIIGLKKQYKEGRLRITPDFAAARALAQAGADIIAVDCTADAWPGAEPWRVIIERIHGELGLPVMADIATLDEALDAEQSGADLVGTTLQGYTERTRHSRGFDWQLLKELIERCRCPIIAEGHIDIPEDARRAIDSGAYAVVVGSAITRPGNITKRFLSEIGQGSSALPVIGIDLGGTSVKGAIVDVTGELMGWIAEPTALQNGRESILASLTLVLEGLLREANTKQLSLGGIGIASAGAIEHSTGSIFAATDNLPGWAGFELKAYIEKRFGLSVHVENDAHAAALSELHFGAGRDLSSFVMLTIGTGVGGGVVIGRKLVRGNHGFAGTFGHQTIAQDGKPCNCGRRGCLEAYVSSLALQEAYSNARGITELRPVSEIASAALAHDRDAESAYASLVEPLAQGVANILNILDPEAILLSGGVVAGQAMFLDQVRGRVEELLHFGAKRSPRIAFASAGYVAGVQGAAVPLFT